MFEVGLSPATDPNVGGYVSPGAYHDGQFGVLILKSCFAKQGGWGAKASSNAHKAGAVWLGNMFEIAGVCFGCVDAARSVK